MASDDPLDAYEDMLRAEGAENDELLAGRDPSFPDGLPGYLGRCASRYEHDRRRYDSDLETEERRARRERATG